MSKLFAIDYLDSEVQLPIALEDHFSIRSADIDEKKEISDRIKWYHDYNKYINLFEYTWIQNEDGPGYISEGIPNPENYKYIIFEVSPNKNENHFAWLLGISKLDLTVALGLSENGMQKSFPAIPVLNHLFERALDLEKYFSPKVISEDAVAELEDLTITFNSLVEGTDQFNNAVKFLNDYNETKLIPSHSPFRILSYISLLESLISSNKKKFSFEESINYQLQKKTTLLNNLFDDPINITTYFEGPDTLTLGLVMAKIYSYRNDIAHGRTSDFENDLQLIGDVNRTVLPFLKELLRKIIIYSIKHPMLVYDLKNC